MLASCSTSDQNGVPGCVIDVAESQDAVAISLWIAADGVQYFFIKSDCCDQFDELYDADCNYVCAPSGGFSGGGDGQCTAAILGGRIGREPLWSK